MYLRLKTKEDYFKLSKYGKTSVVMGLSAFAFVFICYVPYMDNKISAHTYAVIAAVCLGFFIICFNVAGFDQMFLQNRIGRKRRSIKLGVAILGIEIVLVLAGVNYFIYRIINT